jgi:predicted dinucleotide-binding enzyme
VKLDRDEQFTKEWKMKIGILGTGDVGRALGSGFVKHGHEVKMGSREAGNEKAETWRRENGERASAGTFADAAAFGEVVIVATLWTGTENALRLAGPDNLKGKTVIDTVNPLDFSAGVPRLAIGTIDSAGEQIQRWLPDAHVVKAFNIIGNAHMVDPQFPGGPPDMIIAGNDAGAKQRVTGILKDFGWEVIDLGGIESSRYLEPMAMVWILHYFQTKNGNHAFKLLRK